MNSELLKKLGIVCLIVLAVAATVNSGFDIWSKYHRPTELEVENAILKAERDSLRATAESARQLAKFWAAEAEKHRQQQPIIQNHYHEKATRTLGRPFAIRKRVFAEQLHRLDSIGSRTD